MKMELKYKGEITGKKCAIRKLPFESDKSILACPECKSLFHKEHLINWLKTNTNCPICSRDFSKEIRRYSLRLSENNTQLEPSDIDKLPFREFKFTRPLSEVSDEPLSIFQKFFAFFFALTFAFPIQIGFAFSISFPKSLLLCLIDFPLYMMGISLIKAIFTKPKVENTDFWEDITFTENGIIVTTPDISINEFLVEDLKKLELAKTYKTLKDSETIYTITLKLIDLKEKKHNFGMIYSSTDSLQRDHIYSILAYQIRKYYNISTSPTPSLFMVDFIIENPKFIGFSIIGYILLKVVFTLVGSFFIL